MLNSYRITHSQSIAQRVHIVIFPVNYEIVFHETDLLDRSGIIVIAVINNAVDIEHSGSRVNNDVHQSNDGEQDWEKIREYMLGLMFSVTCGKDACKNDKECRYHNMKNQIRNVISHIKVLFSIYFFGNDSYEISNRIVIR